MEKYNAHFRVTSITKMRFQSMIREIPKPLFSLLAFPFPEPWI